MLVFTEIKADGSTYLYIHWHPVDKANSALKTSLHHVDFFILCILQRSHIFTSESLDVVLYQMKIVPRLFFCSV